MKITIMTHHCALNKHLSVMRKKDPSTCDQCGFEETAENIFLGRFGKA